MNKWTTHSIWKRCKVVLHNYLHSRNWGAFCLCLVFATILWFGHALNSIRDQRLHIPIVYTGLNEDVMFTADLPQSFTIYVRDQGKRLRSYREESFSPIQIDLHQQTINERGTFQLTTEAVRQKIVDQLQGTTHLQRVRPENISVTYYKQHHKRVPVRLIGEITLAPQYQFTQAPIISPDSITIYGSQETLADLHVVHTQAINLTQIKDSLQADVPLHAIDNVRFSTEKVVVRAFAEQFTEKVFTLPIRATNVPSGETLRLFPPTAEVTIRVGISHFNDINASDLQVQCAYPTQQANQLPLQLRYTSPYITQTRVTPTYVEYIIEK